MAQAARMMSAMVPPTIRIEWRDGVWQASSSSDGEVAGSRAVVLATVADWMGYVINLGGEGQDGNQRIPG
jgi:hypothetical protein